MKSFLTAILLLSSLTAFSAEKIESNPSSEYQLLDLVLDVHHKYSETSGLMAKVVELLAGDGVNATRMVLILNEGYGEAAKAFELPTMLSSVRRVTFLAKDVVVINYTQDSYEEQGDDFVFVPVRKSMKITLQRDAKGKLLDHVITEELVK